MKLNTIQKAFHDYLLHQTPDIVDAIAIPDLHQCQRRLNIYLESYQTRLHDLLADDFKGTQYLLGAEQFEQLAQAYFAEYPPTTYLPRWFGKHLASFANRYLINHPQLSCIQDMINYEWLLLEIYETANVKPSLTWDTIQTIPAEQWPDLKFVLHPSAHFIALQTNVPLIVDAITNKKSIPELVIDVEKKSWLIWRNQNYMVKTHVQHEIEYIFLHSLHQHHSFADTCEIIAQFYENLSQEINIDLAQQVIGLLNYGINEQIIVALK